MKKQNSLPAEERKLQILDMIRLKNSVNIVNLSKFFNTSEVTIRNDLTELEKDGLVKRTHGGAISTEKTLLNVSFINRIETNIDEKLNIAKKAAQFINEGDSIILDAGTTTLCIAGELKDFENLIIVTNSLPVAHEIGHIQGIQVILLGGVYYWKYKSINGINAIKQLRTYKVNKLFLCADGVSAENGITSNDPHESEMSREMLKCAEKVIVVADFSKIGSRGFAQICGLESVDTIITDNKADNGEIMKIREKGINVVIV